MKRESYAPLFIAIALLLLPAVYVGSYFALVTPRRVVMKPDRCGPYAEYHDYRLSHCDVLFYPLERIDQTLRPGTWETKQ